MGVVTSFGSPVVAGYGAAKRLDSMIMLQLKPGHIS